MPVTNDFHASELDLNGKLGIQQPTALVWGADGRLYVTEVSGDVHALTVEFGDPDPNDADPAAKFHVAAAETINLVKAIPNNNDDGTDSNQSARQVTGIDVTAQYDANGEMVMLGGKPAVVAYVSSSDSRIGAGTSGADKGLDTNSGVITKLVQTASGWEAIDLVRGLPRSEENHATNGLEVIQTFDSEGKLVSERMIVASGGNANTGAPSNNFAGQQEQPLSGAILEIDLTELSNMGVLTDAESGRSYVYDIPTLNDPTRPDGPDGEDAGTDPFGGNDGLNSAKLLADGPVQVYSAGYRNPYDVEVTDDGRVFTYDNGANNNWGGRPAGEDTDSNSTNAEDPNGPNNGLPPGFVATNLFVEDNNEPSGNFNPQNWDQLHEATRSDDLAGRTLSAGLEGAATYLFDHPDHAAPLTLVYGGHPNPTRAEGARAGLLYSPEGGVEDALLMVSNVDKGNGSSDFLEVVAWLKSIGYDDAFINATVVALDPGKTYSDTFAAGFGGGGESGRPSTAGVFSLVEAANGPIGLPADIDSIVGALNPIEGNYLEGGYTDGALDTGKGSVNGLTEYTSTIFDDSGQATMKGALIAASLNNGSYFIMGRDANGVLQTTELSDGRTIADDRTTLSSGGAPLGLASIGDDITPWGNDAAFRGTVWAAIYKQNGPIIEVFQPGNPDTNQLAPVYAGQEPNDPTDNDLDGVDHFNDPFDYDDDNGHAVGVGEKVLITFSQVDQGLGQDFTGTVGDTGLSGAMIDGVTPNRDAKTAEDGINDPALQEDGLFDNGGNIIPGGNAPIFQIKEVKDGTALGAANSLRDGLQTGVRVDGDVERLTAEALFTNWYADQPGDGRVTGVSFGDGTQSNFVRFVWGDVGSGQNGGFGLQLVQELNDVTTVLATIGEPALYAALTDGSQFSSQKIITLRLEISDIGGDYALRALYSLDGGAFEAVPGSFALPAGTVLRDVLDGTHTISDGDTTLPSGAAFGILAEKPDGVQFDNVDIPQIEIRAFGNEIVVSNPGDVASASGTSGTDTVVYTGASSGAQQDLGALQAGVENFDGSGSSADFAIAGNASDNVIRVGSGANTVATGGGADVVTGTLSDLDGDTVTDFTEDDTLVIEDLSTADISGLSFQDGSAIVTINGSTLTLDGPAFEEFDAANGAAYLEFEDTVDGLAITARAPLAPVVAIDAGGTGNTTVTLRDTEVTFQGDGGGSTPIDGVTTSGQNKAYTNGTAGSTDFPDTDLDPVLATERSSAGDFGYAIDVPDGTYLIDFLFAEIYHGLAPAASGNTGGGFRVFDVDVEGDEVITNLDVQAEAGGAGKLLTKTYEVTVTDGTLNILFNQDTADADQAKLSGMVIWSTNGSFVPVDSTAPVVESVSLENPQNFSDGVRKATVVVSDDTAFAPDAFDGLTGAALQFSGIVPDAVSDPTVTLSGDGKTATLSFDVTGPGNAWPDGTVGTISLAAGAFSDAAGNASAAASGGFVVQSNLAALTRGEVVRAINLGTTDPDVGDLVGPDDASYGGAIASDSLITDAAGQPISFEADDDAYHTSPKPSQNNNVDGKFTDKNNNPNLDGSAYHTYRDSNATEWTSTFDGFANGTYVVELHFAELFHEAAGARVGDFTVNGVAFGDDYDAFVQGGGTPDQPSLVRKAVTVTDGNITVDVASEAGQAGYSAIVVYEAVDPSGPASISVADVAAVEGDTVDVVLTRLGDTSEETTVDVALAFDGTADAADVGVLSASSLTFSAGETAKTVTLAIEDDDLAEGAESLSVVISNPTGGAVIGTGSATVTIQASDNPLQVPGGGTVLELDFETAGDPFAEGGFGAVLGGSGALEAGKISIADGKLKVQTSDGDLSQDGQTDSKNDLVRTVDLSDPALDQVYITTAFDNPFTDADGVPQNFVQQGIIIAQPDPATNQDSGQFVKLIFGGNSGLATQLWSDNGNAFTQTPKVTNGNGTVGPVAQAAAEPFGLADIARVELSLAIDKAAGTIAQYVTYFGPDGAALGGVRPTTTDGFLTQAPITLEPAVAAAIADGTSVVGVTSTDYGGSTDNPSFEATWDFLSITSPQAVAADPTIDRVGGAPVEGGDFSDDGTAPTDLGTLVEGETTLAASQQGDSEEGGRDRDYITFTVAEGQILTGLFLDGWDTEESGTPQAFIAIARGAEITFDPTDDATAANFPAEMIGGYIYNEGDIANPATFQDGNLLDDLATGTPNGATFPGFTPPLEAGTYTVWLNQGGAVSTASLRLVTEPDVVTISVADAADATEGADPTLDFSLIASKAIDGEVSVTFDAGEGAQTQAVTFANGVGVLSLPVTDDEVDDGDLTVSLTLTGATSAAIPNPLAISATDADAQGVILEDDGVITYFKGDRALAVNAGNGGGLADDAILGGAFASDAGLFTGSAGAYTDGGSGADATGDNAALDGSIFETERYGETLTYTLTQDGSGAALQDGDTYLVEVYLTELFLDGTDPAKQRIFDVSVNGELVRDDLNLTAEGVDDPATAEVEGLVTVAATATVVGGQIVIELDASGPDGADNAKISGLALFEAIEEGNARVSVADVQAVEGAAAAITFTRDGDPGEAITITYSTVDGTAVAGDDFTGASGATAVIPAGETSVTVPLVLTDDSAFEPAETFTVTIDAATAPTHAVTIAENTATVTVADDDIAAGTAPDEDLDGDGVVNATDADVDGDGVDNEDETFSYDATNAGTALALGEVVRFEFDTDGTPFENGLTGALVSPNPSVSEINLGNAGVSGGSLNVSVTKGDHFSNTNAQENAFVAAFSAPEGMAVQTRFAIPDFDPETDGVQSAENFQSAGVVIGTDQDNLVKFVYGRANDEFELAQDNVNGNGGGKGISTGAGTTPAGAVEVELRLEVYLDDAGAARARGIYTFFDANDDPIDGHEGIVFDSKGTTTNFPLSDQTSGTFSNTLKTQVETGAPLGAGVIHTSTGGNQRDGFNVSYQYLEVEALDLENDAPGVALTPVLTEIIENADTTDRIKVADIVVTDDSQGENVLGLTGDDAALFEIDGTELFLKAGTELDDVANPTLDVAVTVDDATVGATPDATAALAITVAKFDAPPTLDGGVPNQTADEDAVFTFAIPADAFADDEGAANLTLTATLADGTVLPTWLSFDGTAFSGTPSQADVDGGPLDVVVTATDAGGSGVDAAFTLNLTAVNDAPVAGDDQAESLPSTALKIDVATLLANDTDEESATLTIQSVGAAVGGIVSIEGDEITFVRDPNHDGPATFEYVVEDEDGATDTATVTVTEGSAQVVTDILLSQDALRGYAGQDAEPGSVTVADGGDAITFAGNSWKASTLPGGELTITPGMKLRFSFEATDLAEIHMIGFETDDTLANGGGELYFLLGGTQTNFRLATETLSPKYELADGVREYEIDLTPYAGQTVTSLVLANDADQETGVATFSNIDIVRPLAANTAPVATDDAFTIAAGTAATFTPADLLANDVDPDGDDLSILSVSGAQGGSVSINSSGLVVFTPDGSGTPAGFDYTVSDGAGGIAQANVTLNIDGAPTVSNVTLEAGSLRAYGGQDRTQDTATVSDGELTLSGNNWKSIALPDGGYGVTADTVLRFTFQSDDESEINAIGLETNDALGDASGEVFFQFAGTQTLRGAIQVTPVSGDLSTGAVFEIDLGAFAGQTFPRMVFVNDLDGFGNAGASNPTGNGTFSAVAFVEPGDGGASNASPVAGDDQFLMEQDTTLTLLPGALLGNDTDEDGDDLSIATVGGATGGTVSIDAQGRVEFTADPGFIGKAAFTYTVTDGAGGADTATVEIDVLEPGAGEVTTEIDFAFATISSYGGQDARPGAGTTVEAGGSTLRLDGNVWKAISIAAYDVTEDTVLRFDHAVGTLGEIHAIGLDDDNGFSNGGAFFQMAGSQTWGAAVQVAPVGSGPDGFASYEIDLGAFAGQTFDRLVLVNDDDAAPDDAAETFSNVRLVETGVDVGQGEAPYIFGGTIDPLVFLQGQGIEVSLPILDDDTDVADLDVTFTNLPGFLSADGTLLQGEADDADVGTYTVGVTATDPELNSVSSTFTVEIVNVNDDPVAAAEALPSQQTFLGGLVAVDLPAGFFTDADIDTGDSLTYTLVGAPEGIEIDPVTGRITGSPTEEGTFEAVVRATDASGAFDEATLSFEVDGGPPRESVVIEAEAFTGLASSAFREEVIGSASGDRVIRLDVDQSGEVTTDLAAAGTVPGFYDLTVTYYDENDGTAALTILIDDGTGPVELDSRLLDAVLPGQNSATAAANRTSFTITGVEVKPGSELILQGAADRELVRIDRIALDPVENAPPVLDATASVTVDENTTAVTTVEATDPENAAISYAIAGGADADLFAVDATTGALSFKAAPDFETLAKTEFEVVVSASDGSLSSEQTVTVTVADANEAPISDAPSALRATQGEAVALPTLDTLFSDVDAGDALTFAVEGLPDGVTLAADGVTLEGTPTATGAATVTVTATDAGGLTAEATFDIMVVEPGAFDPALYAPDADLDGDGILNAVDDDVDGDTVANADDPFAYDAEDGMTLAAGQSRNFAFDLDGTPWENGLTGFLQGTTNGGAFDEDTGATSVSGGALVVDPVTDGDTGGNNDPEDDAVVGIKNGTFTATTIVTNPWFGAATNPNSFDQLGLAVGVDSLDMAKLVFGQSAGVVEFQVQTGGVGVKYPSGANVPLPAGAGLDDFASAEITFEVTSTDASSAGITASVRFLAEDGTELASETYGTAPITGALAAALADPSEGVAVGFTHVNGGGAPGFVAEMQDLTITAPDDGTGGSGGTGEVLLRINAFGPQVAATDGGPAWLADGEGAANSPYLVQTNDRGDVQGFSGDAATIPDGVPQAVLDTARSSDNPFSYQIPVTDLEGNGNYTVTLHFAELFAGNQTAGERSFDVSIEGQTLGVLDNVDPSALSGGGGNAASVTYNVAVTDGVLDIGFTQDIADNPIVNAIEVATFGGTIDPPGGGSDPADALEAFAAADNIDTGGTYGAGAVGSARLAIMEGAGNVKQSNFGSNSFVLENTGDKQVAAVFIDFRSALYGDSVVDPDGKGGDQAAKLFDIDSGAGTTGAYFDNDPSQVYLLPGADPLPNTTGTGIASNGGFRGLMVKFDGSDGGFSGGESIGFSGDMDPNSVAGLEKGGSTGIDTGSVDGWDVGGVSGAELIGSVFTVLFDDGSTASGVLGSDESQAGSVGTAVEGRDVREASVLVDGISSQQFGGTYGGTEPVITVTGTPGDTVRVVLTKGLNPVTNESAGVADLVDARLEDARGFFPASNAADFQTVDVTIGADGIATVPPGAFDYNAPQGGADFSGSAFTPGYETAPIAVAAAVIGSDGTPAGRVDRVYLESNGTPVEPAQPDGYFEMIGSGSSARFKIQIEDENANGGTDPGGNWTYVEGDGADGNQSGTQGTGHYFWGSEAASTALNPPQPASFLDYTIFVPEGEEGVFNLRVRASRDTNEPGDQRNDVWVRIDDDAEALQVSEINSVSSNGFVKVFGGGTGNWGYAQLIDSVSEEEPNFGAAFELEAGLHTVTLAGRSQGFHIDWFELYKGGSPSVNGSDSDFVEGEPGSGGTGGGGTGGGTAGEDQVIAVDASSDDWEEFGGAISSDLEFGLNGSQTQFVGIRFDGIQLEAGAQIAEAWIEFEANGTETGDADFTIAIEDGTDVPTYSGANSPAERDYLADELVWADVEGWTNGQTYRTPDISGLIEDLVGGAAVEDGAFGFLFEGSGSRAAHSFDSDGDAPVLHILLEGDTPLG